MDTRPIGGNMNIKSLRTDFTLTWESLGVFKTFVISFIAIVIAVASLSLAKWAFPTADFTAVQAIILTAISGVITSLIKDAVKV